MGGEVLKIEEEVLKMGRAVLKKGRGRYKHILA